jgi:hypothetical protein
MIGFRQWADAVERRDEIAAIGLDEGLLVHFLDVDAGGKTPFSLPVMTMQPISGSASKPSSARLSSLMRSALRAFSACVAVERDETDPYLPVVTMIVS